MSMIPASKDYFQKIAGTWDEVSVDYFGPELRQLAIDKSYLHPEMQVADIGGGTGFLSMGLAPFVKKVHLVDGSEEMLSVARKNLAQFTNVEFHHADGSQLPFADQSLDAVFANMYLHHVVDPKAAILEMVRVLRPGGRLMITDMVSHPYEWLKEEMADIWLGFDRDDILDWYSAAEICNFIYGTTGQSCCAKPQTDSDSPSQREVEIGVFFATGTRRMSMRQAVMSSYAEIASSGCSCGGQQSAASASTCCSSASDGAAACCQSQDSSIVLSPGYTPDDLANAPTEAADISLGCGNPGAFAQMKPGDTVLDIGSGGGLDVFLAAKKVGPMGKVIGVDMTSAMIQRVVSSATRMGIHNVEFRIGMAEDLPVETSSVDQIISNCVINISEDKSQVFKEAYRVTRPGGRLDVSDMVLASGISLDLRADAVGWAECVTGALPEQEYLDLITQAGYNNLVVQRTDQIGEIADVPVYSITVSATKPAGEDCGCGTAKSTCCCG